MADDVAQHVIVQPCQQGAGQEDLRAPQADDHRPVDGAGGDRHVGGHDVGQDRAQSGGRRLRPPPQPARVQHRVQQAHAQPQGAQQPKQCKHRRQGLRQFDVIDVGLPSGFEDGLFRRCPFAGHGVERGRGRCRCGQGGRPAREEGAERQQQGHCHRCGQQPGALFCTEGPPPCQPQRWQQHNCGQQQLPNAQCHRHVDEVHSFLPALASLMRCCSACSSLRSISRSSTRCCANTFGEPSKN